MHVVKQPLSPQKADTDLYGFGFTYGSGSVPTGGTVTSLAFDLDNSAASELVMTGLSAPLAALASLVNKSSANPNALYWRTFLSGSDGVNFGTHATSGNFSILFAGDAYVALAQDRFTCAGDSFTGDIGVQGRVAGDVDLLQSGASIIGGNDTFTVTGGEIVAGDVLDARGFLQGGNDILTEQAGASTSYLVGDVAFADDGVIFGGKDTLTLVSSGFAAGDVLDAQGSGTVVAGDDIIRLTGGGSAAGDVRGLIGNLLAGNDTITGGTGDNEIAGDFFSASQAFMTRAGSDTIHGMGGNDTIYGDWKTVGSGSVVTGGNDFLYGEAGNDTIYGNDGDDVIDGGADVDTLYGGNGNDTFHVDTNSDRVRENVGQGTDTVITTGTFFLFPAAEIEVLKVADPAGTQAADLTGNGFAQTITGNAGANIINGGASADMMIGLGGNDTYYVDNGGDRISEASGGGTDTVIANVSFSLGSTPEVETLKTSDASSTAAIDLTGSNTANALIGNAGANTLNGLGGADAMQGLGGDDRYYVDNASDQVVEAANGGSEKLFTYVTYALTSGSEVESLYVQNSAGTDAINLTGNDLAQSLQGNAGANALSGGGGNDGLLGLLGNDTLTGGAGNDSFFFNTALGAANVDHITDFANVTNDNDLFRLDRSFFAGLSVGALVAGDTFASNGSGTANANTHAQIIYNTTTGALVYDGNGGTAGGATQFAAIDNHAGLTGAAALSAADFIVY